MPINCPNCNRTNPDEALYCFNDGVALGGAARPAGPIAVGVQLFASPFVFPSGRFCRTFDELVLASEEHWDEARELLREGMLESFLSGMGRTDLSWVARKCAEESDPDLALDHLLAKLPGDRRKPAQLAVQPPEINLGTIARGADHRFVVHLLNEGMGLLRGSVTCVEADWLILGEEAGASNKVFQFRHDQTLTLRAVAKRLRAGVKPQEGRLVIESNGGSVVVLVRVEAPAILPFSGGVLSGAKTPRVLAEKTKANPREAAVFFENGSVARWYDTNAWTYPVLGPPASGMAALQQYYEALGLAAPPRVELEHEHIRLEGPPGAALETAIVVQTSERRAVFAHATTAAPWLKIGSAVLAGRTARIPVQVPDVPRLSGEQLRAQVQVTANGNQRFTVDVALTVLAEAVAAEDYPTLVSAEIDEPTSRPARGPTVRPRSRAAAPAARKPGALAWILAGGFLALAAAAVIIVVLVVVLTPEPDAARPAPIAQAAPPHTKPGDAPVKDDNKPPKDPPAPAPPPPADIADLARLLASDDAEERVSAVKKLGAMGPKAAPALGDVLKAMKDGDAGFRREALAALPKIGQPTVAEVNPLADLAGSDGFPEGRLYALDALLALGADARPAAGAVCDALKDRSPTARRKAAEILGKIGAAAREAAHRDLIDALRDSDPAVGAAAAAALGKMGPAKMTDAPTLQLLLSSQEKAAEARRFGLNGFRELGQEAAAFAPYLEDAIADDPSPALRKLAITALVAVQPTARRSADAFSKALSDADLLVRIAASEALARVGVANGALPGLIQALGAEDEPVRKTAEGALNGAKLDKNQIAEIGEKLRTKNAKMRLRLMVFLKTLGADAEPAVPGLSAVVKEGAGEPRKQAIALLTAMGPAAKKAAGTLEDLCKDDQFIVRLDAATALAAIEGPDADAAIPVLLDALKVEKLDDPEQEAERDRAVEAFGRIGEPAVKPLVNALENDFVGGGTGAKGKINIQARLAAVKALGAMGPTPNNFKAISALTNLGRSDPSPAVRDAAKDARAAIRKQ